MHEYFLLSILYAGFIKFVGYKGKYFYKYRHFLKIQVLLRYDACWSVSSYQHFGGACGLHFQGPSMILGLFRY
jgi:hypothetical protein